MRQEIGSNFWISPDDLKGEADQISLKGLGLSGDDEIFLSTGRAAQSFILDDIERKHKGTNNIALIPPFTCYSVITPFLLHGYVIHTYPIDKHLHTSPVQLKEAIDYYKPSVVLIHRYFGFDTACGLTDVIKNCSRKGTVFIEDRTHSLFSQFESLPVQYLTGSIRKWAGLPDGGFAISLNGKMLKISPVYDKELVNAEIEASLAKYDYLFNGIGEKEDFLKKYRKAEELITAEKDYYSISPVSQLLFSNLDRQELRSRRRKNYNILRTELNEHKDCYLLFSQADENTTPLYFAMWINDREALQRKLRDERIYAPVIWPRPETIHDICKEAEDLYQHILCIPVDQRYQDDDMQRIAKCINTYNSKC